MIQKEHRVVSNDMHRASGTNRNTMLFYYRTSPLVALRGSTTHVDESVLFVQACQRPTTLVEYVYSETRPYCPLCMHDTHRAPYCGGVVCETIQSEIDAEFAWTFAQEISDASDGDYPPTEELELDGSY